MCTIFSSIISLNHVISNGVFNETMQQNPSTWVIQDSIWIKEDYNSNALYTI